QRRDYNLHVVRFRTGYEVSRLLTPYIDISANRRDYDYRRDNERRLQNSHGWRALAGLTWEPTGLIRTDIALGWGEQYPDDPARRTLSGPLMNATVTWEPTALTSLAIEAEADI